MDSRNDINSYPLKMEKNLPPHTACTWQQQLKQAFHSIGELCDYLALNPQDIGCELAQQNFPIRVPRGFAACMEKGNAADPLLKQVLPVRDEMQSLTGFSNDPVGDLAAMTNVGVIHKYQGRALFITTGGCAVHCRYCFRRNFPYSQFQLTQQKQQAAINYLQDNPDISEIILSGGDPLLLSDSKLIDLIAHFKQIPHLKRLRIHSRLPIVLPARITPALLEALKNSGKAVVMVVHCNHPHELSDEVKASCKAMREATITLLNQAVLLRGVNDNMLILKELSEKSHELGVLPYYLHLLDKANGTGHFDVPISEARALMRELQACLPGYLVPKLAREEAGKAAKTIIF